MGAFQPCSNMSGAVGRDKECPRTQARMLLSSQDTQSYLELLSAQLYPQIKEVIDDITVLLSGFHHSTCVLDPTSLYLFFSSISSPFCSSLDLSHYYNYAGISPS